MSKPVNPPTEARFRSPDTMTREQWDEMRSSLPDKIDEVMASFRDDKLEVQPRAANDEALPSSPMPDKPQAVQATPAKAASSGKGWLIGLLLIGLALAGGFWLLRSPAKPAAVTPAPTTEYKLLQPDPVTEPPPMVRPRDEAPAPVAKPAAPPKPVKKPKPAAKQEHKPAEEEVRFSEDLTPLLRGDKQP